MPVVNQSNAPAIPGGTDMGVASILQTIQGKNQQVQQNLNAQPQTVAQTTGDSVAPSGVASTTEAATPMTSPVVAPNARAQAPAWITPPQQHSKAAQSHADVGALINNIQGLVHTAATNQNNRNVARATNDWNRLMKAMQNPDDPQNQTIIQSILGDPKLLKQMSKALHIDYLNPAKGADNVYRQALMQAIKEHQLKAGALDKLKELLGFGGTPDVHLTPQQHAQLAQQMEQRFPKVPETAAQMLDKVKSSILQRVMTDPKGIANGIGALNEKEQQLLGVGITATQEARDSTMLEIQGLKNDAAQVKLAQQASEFSQQIQQKIETRDQQNSQFQQNQQLRQQIARTNTLVLTQRLNVEAKNATTAQGRLAAQQEQVSLAKNRAQVLSLNTQLDAIQKNINDLTSIEKGIMTSNKSQPGTIAGIFDKNTGVTAAGQQQITAIESQISAAKANQAQLLTQQETLVNGLMTQVNSTFGLSSGNSGNSGTPSSSSNSGTPATTPPQSTASPSFKVGDSVMYNGKQHKITAIKNGQAILDSTE